ncbi:MAG: hypothetical protein ACLRWP_03240 [Bilophila wadsworthia]
MKYEGSRDVNEAYTQWREFRRVPVPRLVNKIGISHYMELPTNDLGALSRLKCASRCGSTSAPRPRPW